MVIWDCGDFTFKSVSYSDCVLRYLLLFEDWDLSDSVCGIVRLQAICSGSQLPELSIRLEFILHLQSLGL